MPVTEITVASLGKWVGGLILAPWLWYERKRFDKLKENIERHYYTKIEAVEQIELRSRPIIEKLDMIHNDVTMLRQAERAARNDD
jgi:hypothetical protein